MTHATNDDLCRYLDGNHEDAPTIAQHLTSCKSCQVRLEDVRSFTKLLKNPNVWGAAPVTPPPSFIERLARIEATFAQEDERAARLLPWLRSAAAEPTAIPNEWRTSGVVRTLLRVVTDERDHNPTTALGLARLARQIAITIPVEAYPSPIVIQLQGQAWKEEANLLRHIGEYNEALHALDRAEECFGANATGAYDLALVDLVRAMTLSQGMGRPEDVVVLLRRAGQTFRTYGDDRRSLHARLVEAACVFDMGAYAQARDVFQSLLPDARTSGDRETLARLVANIACCDAELDLIEPAAAGFLDAITLYNELGMTGEIVRARWGLARLRTRRQEYDAALQSLHEAEAEFTALGMHGEAGLVLLDTVETLLAIGRSDDIPVIMNGLVERFTRSGATPSAMTALAYLREAVTERRVLPRDVQAVRSWLTRPHDPRAAFTPPT